MMTTDALNSLFTKYNDLAAANADLCTDRNLHMLMMYAFDSDHMDFDGDCITLTQGSGPLAKIEIERISGAEDLGSHMAMILPASLVLVNKRTGAVSVYLPD